MADVKISALPALSSAALTDLFAVVQGGVTYKGTLTQLVAAIPDATGSTRGLLAAADWTTFNSKQSALTFSTGLTNAAGTVTSNLSTGVAGGQSVIGGTAASNSLTLSSTSNATKGKILFGTSAYDEVNNRLGIGTASPSLGLDVVGQGLFTSSAFPTARFNRTTTANGFYVTSNDLLATTSGDMVDGFGVQFVFSIQDNANVINQIGFIKAGRFGSDTTGYISLAPASGGNAYDKLVVFGSSGDVLIQNPVSQSVPNDAGFRLDVNGTARVQGDLTISTKNIITDTTTGTKIGTATGQKLSLWNAAPDVQPTTAITAAAFAANTSGIVDDTATFGGYTMGQVVAALKRLGALA